ncbi:MAG TPA: serine/threonine protein kinase [Pseudolabrys sp.]|nr:serine/threonine protein kinase [Pseudolabrys sp.]
MNNSSLSGSWRSDVLLKRDVFSVVERGRFLTDKGEVNAVLRRIDEVPWWSRMLARHLFGREARALKAAPAGVAPPLLYVGSDRLVRAFIDGVALHIARPNGDRAYFNSAKAALRKLHRAGICHNDLAKEQNWLRTPDGHACLTDFQLSMLFTRRGKLFRVAAYEDLRHLLKHKRRYAPEALTPAEKRVLARKSVFTRVWMATGKRVYYAVTRGLFNFSDREGGGRKLKNQAPAVVARLRQHPHVREVVVVAYPDRRAGTGLYAFVEASGVSEANLRNFLKGSADAPERIQIVDALPRRNSGEVRSEILQLVAINQIDSIDSLIGNDDERTVVATIIAGRQNLRDRFAY